MVRFQVLNMTNVKVFVRWDEGHTVFSKLIDVSEVFIVSIYRIVDADAKLFEMSVSSYQTTSHNILEDC
jgi:hypothetical protein